MPFLSYLAGLYAPWRIRIAFTDRRCSCVFVLERLAKLRKHALFGWPLRDVRIDLNRMRQ